MRNWGRRWNPGNGLLNNEELEINNPHCSHNKVPLFALLHGSILYFLFQTLLHFISSWSYLSIMRRRLCFLSCEITGYVFVGEAEIWQNIGEMEIKRVRLYLNSGSDSLITQGEKEKRDHTIFFFISQISAARRPDGWKKFLLSTWSGALHRWNTKLYNRAADSLISLNKLTDDSSDVDSEKSQWWLLPKKCQHPPSSQKINGISVSAFLSTLISVLKKMVMRPLLILSASCLKVTVVPARRKAGKGSSGSSVGDVGGYLTRLEQHGKPSDCTWHAKPRNDANFTFSSE